MRALAPISALALSVALVAACAAPAVGTKPTTTADVGEQGPLSGTYSADSLDGKAPFVAVTFTDKNHYQYVDKTCVAPLGDVGDDGETDGSELGDDPGDAVADGNATAPSTDTTDNGCIHNGTYVLTDDSLSLKDDGASKSIVISIGPLSANGTEIADPNASTSTALAADALIVGISALFGSSSVSQFTAGGTDLRRTGLIIGQGILTALAGGSDAGASSSSSGGSLIESATSDAGAGSGSDDSETPGTTTTAADDTAKSLVTNGAVALAQKWVDVKMPYCQAVNGGRELGAACRKLHGATCNRTGAANNPAWNAYRSDCSGLVSYAWSLKAPGLTTSGFLPGTGKYIPMKDLAPGDALIRPGHHMVLFKAWADKASGKAKVLAEPGCSSKGGPHAQEQTWSFKGAPGAGTSATVSGGTYYAIRKKSSGTGT